MVSPQRDVFIMLDKKILHDEIVSVFFRMGQDLNDRLHTAFVGIRGKSASRKQAPECIIESGLRESFAKPCTRKFVILERVEDLLVLLSGDELQFAKLHGLKSARRI